MRKAETTRRLKQLPKPPATTNQEPSPEQPDGDFVGASLESWLKARRQSLVFQLTTAKNRAREADVACQQIQGAITSLDEVLAEIEKMTAPGEFPEAKQ